MFHVLISCQDTSNAYIGLAFINTLKLIYNTKVSRRLHPIVRTVTNRMPWAEHKGSSVGPVNMIQPQRGTLTHYTYVLITNIIYNTFILM